MTSDLGLAITGMDEKAAVEKDITDLKRLLAMAKRDWVKQHLEETIEERQAELHRLETAPVNTNSVSNHTSAPLLPTIKITNYAWDQSDKFVKLYLTIPDVQAVAQEQIVVTFTESEVDVLVNNVNSKNYTLVIKSLLNQIVPDSSRFKQKTDLLLIMMKKKRENESWKYLTKAEMSSKEKSKPKFDEKADPQESLMGMMKQMYDEGDDEMKRTIRKAWYESQAKKGNKLTDDTLEDY